MNRPGSVAVRADTREIARNRGITRPPKNPERFGIRPPLRTPTTRDSRYRLAYAGLGPPALARHFALLQEPS